MTIASEITRLQWAKSSARTSIINKGVSVPASAKLDTYHNYIDQISTGWAFMDSLSLAWRFFDGRDLSPRIDGYVSWNTNSAYYWASIITLESSSSEEYYLTCFKKVSWSDMQYLKWSTSPWSSSIHSRPHKIWFYKKADALRVFFSEVSTYSSNYAFWFQWDWDLSWTPTLVQIARNNSYNELPASADTTGYTQITTNSWIKSLTWDAPDDNAYIYLKTK